MTAVCPAGHTSAADDYCDVCGVPIASAAVTPTLSTPPSAPAPSAVPTQAPGAQLCPNCSTENVADALFCESCGYDFTTGTMPRSASAPPAGAVDTGAPGPDQAAPGKSGDTAGAAPADAGAGGPDQGGSQAPPDASEEQGAETPNAGAPTNVSASLTSAWVAEVWIDPAWYQEQDSPDPLPSPGLPVVVPLRNKSILVGRMSRSRNIHPDIDCEPDTGTSRRQAQLTSDGTRWWVEDLDSANGTFVAEASGALPTDPIPVGQKVELDPDDRIYVGAWTRLVIREATEDEMGPTG